MHYISVESSHSLTAMACGECCCEQMALRPGETDLLVVNYAAWSVPIGGRGILPGFSYAVEASVSLCDTVGSPSNENYTVMTCERTEVSIDVSESANVLTDVVYDTVPLAGPRRGSVVQTAAGGPVFIYTPQAGFSGYDYFHYSMTANGQTIIRAVEINVGTHAQPRDNKVLSTGPYLDVDKSSFDQQAQTVNIPIHMPFTAGDCDNYKVTIEQRAIDCNCNVYNCFHCVDFKTKC